jgi:hypothetical protein
VIRRAARTAARAAGLGGVAAPGAMTLVGTALAVEATALEAMALAAVVGMVARLANCSPPPAQAVGMRPGCRSSHGVISRSTAPTALRRRGAPAVAATAVDATTARSSPQRQISMGARGDSYSSPGPLCSGPIPDRPARLATLRPTITTSVDRTVGLVDRSARIGQPGGV